VIDFYASEPHFADHLTPIWRALPPEHRGRFVVHQRLPAARVGVPVENTPAGLGVTVVASYGDLKKVRQHTDRVIYMEHGAGQSYVSDRPIGSYLGAADRDGVIAVLVPGPHSFRRARSAYPDLPVYEVGCPKLDRLIAQPTPTDGVAVSFHWDPQGVAHEARSAWSQFGSAAMKLPAEFGRVIGHGHPRAMPRYALAYARAGLDVVWQFADVVPLARTYVIDNSSTMFEWAALDRPVVVMNARWYRRDVEHGLRFWEFADVGVQVDHPSDLAAAVRSAQADTVDQRARRREIVAGLYAHLGNAAPTAAEAVIEAAGRVRA
jgi:hypothetical protein